MMAFYHGCMVYLIEQADPDQLLTAIVERKLTQGLVVPTVINALLMSPRIATLDLTSLKIIMYGGSPIAPETLVKAMEVFGCGLAQGYGMTEVAGACIFLAPEDHDPSKPNHLLSIGRPSALAKLDVRDAQGDSLPDGEVGEFWINSVGLMKGYWRRPGEDEVVLRDGWYRSGDAGYRDADGFYYLTDRVKDMIVSGAENVYPAEVERALMQHPSLLEVAVIGIPHEKWGEAAHAIAVLKPGADTSADEILAFTRRLLAGFKVPKSLEFISALPRNAFGKVPKYVLREPFWAGHKRRVG